MISTEEQTATRVEALATQFRQNNAQIEEQVESIAQKVDRLIEHATLRVGSLELPLFWDRTEQVFCIADDEDVPVAVDRLLRVVAPLLEEMVASAGKLASR